MNRTIFALLVLGLCLVSTVSSGEVSKKLLKKLANYHLMKSCWGEENTKKYFETLKASVKKCQNLTPTFDLDIFEENNSSPYAPPAGFDNNRIGNINNPYDAWMAFLAFQQSQNGGRRFRRATQKSAEEIAEFKMNVMEYKDQKMANLGNLTCVLADMGVLDANLNINLNYFTRDAWNEYSSGNIDPDFKNKLNECTEDCYTISQSIPQAVLDKHPIYKKFGRNIIFFKCQYKAEINLCAKQEISRYYEEKYGPATPAMLKEYGLPEDKFDAAYMSKKVHYMSMSESEKFVYKKLLGGSD